MEKLKNNVGKKIGKKSTEIDLLKVLISNEYQKFYDKNYRGIVEVTSKDEIFQGFLEEFSRKYKGNERFLEKIADFKSG